MVNTSLRRIFIHRVWMLVIIATLIFANLGIQPVKANSPSTLIPNEQLGKRSSGLQSSQNSIIIRENVQGQGALQFDGIDTTKTILSAELKLYILSYSGLPTTLTVGIGENNWTSSTSNVNDFPEIKNGLSQGYPIGASTSGDYLPVPIDVTALLNSPTALEGQKVTFIISSNVNDIEMLRYGHDGSVALASMYPTLEITYAATNSAPTDITLDNNIIDDNQPAGTTIGTFSAIDPDAGDVLTYSLVSGEGDTDNQHFAIVNDALQTTSTLIHGTYSIRIRATDSGGLTFEKSFTIIVTNTNQAPTDITLSNANIAENEPINTVIGTLAAVDPDAGDTFTYALVSGAGSTDNGRFTISGNELRTVSMFDYEMKNSYSIRIRVTDNRGATFEKVFTITITDVNEAPTDITLTPAIIDENQPIGTTVGTLTTVDPDAGDTFTYTLVAGAGSTDNGNFTISGTALRTASMFDYEAKNSYSIRVRVSDSGEFIFEKIFTITVIDVNEAPTDITLTSTAIDENQPIGTTVGTLTTIDPDAGDTSTYTLVSGTGSTDNGSFMINGNELRTANEFDFETKSNYNIRVRATDSGGLYFEKTFTITVNDVPEDPEPTIVSTTPANNSTNVAVNPTLTLTFSEDVSAVIGKNIRIYNQANHEIEAIEVTTQNITINGAVVSISLPTHLLKGTTYYVLVDDGAFVDSANQPAGGITSPTAWRFTTVPPSANAQLSNIVLSSGSLSPGFDSDTMSYNVQVAHDVSSIDITASLADSASTMTINGSLLANAQAVNVSLLTGTNIIGIVVTAEDGTTTRTYNLTITKATPPLEQVGDVNFSSLGIATWADVANEVSYAVQLYKDNIPVGSRVSVGANNLSYDFLATMRTEEAGHYTVTVVAKGDGIAYLDAPDSEPSNTQTIIKLATPTGSVWDGKVAKWQAVPHAVSYDVQLYKETVALGAAVNVVANDEQIDLTTAMQSIGDYTFTVQAKGDAALVLDGEVGNSSSVYSVTPPTYTVEYDGNGHTSGTVPIDSTAYLQNATVIIADNSGDLRKVGHTFTGWNTAADGTGTTYLPNADFIMEEENVTLYANWAINHYTVTFETNGGNIIAAQNIVYNKGLIPPQPIRQGYTFAGWYKDANFEYPWNSMIDVVTQNITLYAKWLVNGAGISPLIPEPPSINPVPPPSTQIEQIVIDIKSTTEEVVTQIIVKRTTNADGTRDEVILTEESMSETVAKLREMGANTLRLAIPDAQNLVTQIDLSILANALKILKQDAIHLDILTNNVEINVVSNTLATFEGDLYFRLIPIKTTMGQAEIEQRLKQQEMLRQLLGNQDVKLLGQPMKMETNMQNRPVTLTLPLFAGLPNEQLAQLAVFIEHSDGTNEIVRGQIVDFQNERLGFQFEVNKFSTFSLISLPITDKPEVEEIYLPYIQGYVDGTFRLNAPVTRAQIATMFARHLTNDEIPQAIATFTDTVGHGAKDAIEYVRENGLFDGATATTFQPNQSITRAQMAAVAVRWIERQCASNSAASFCKQQGEAMVFKDVQSNHWAAEAIGKISALGIMTGVSDKQFNPHSTLTRAQAVKVLNRLFERSLPIEVETPLFTDVPTEHWAFFEIYGAALPQTKK
ncbi:cadherin domain-containing protein [Metasolibacillus meyeri]|uniref:cadherin domain-containing protein n=1 Tax=Metasolibacillus meyeri TaxID=1071052 RepID=UPI000D30F988|nr:cadherin domain-containing protein [Metasolibacillus meyeri]